MSNTRIRRLDGLSYPLPDIREMLNIMAATNQRATIRDVAREAGVSHQTVSRVINERAEVSPETRQRVREAMARLNYRPSRIAQSLTTHRTHTIGLLVPNIAYTFYADIALGSQHLAREHDYNVFLCNTGWDPAEELHLLYSLARHRVDGIILHGSRCSDDDLRVFVEGFRPVLLGGRTFRAPGVCSTETDHLGGATLLAEYLVERGHTAIGMVMGEKTQPTMSNAIRLAAYRTALEACGIPVPEHRIAHGPLTTPGGYASTHELLDRAPEITAIMAHNDLVAIGAIRACQKRGLRVPEDVAVTGFSDIELASMVTPDVTTIHVDCYGIGREATARMLEMIENPDREYAPLATPADAFIVRASA